MVLYLKSLGYFIEAGTNSMKWVIDRDYSENEIKQFLDIIEKVITKIKERGIK